MSTHKLVINPVKAPCKDCTERHINCHGNCIKYLEYRKTVDAYNTKDRQERIDHYEELQSYYNETKEHKYY